jgi:hypothetical protein
MTEQKERATQFVESLNVVNAALAENKDKFPYEQILAAAGNFAEDRNLGVAVYKDDPSKPFDYFTVRLRDGKFELVSHGKEDPDIAWRVSQEYLDRVANNAEEYIAHPAKLDLDWLKDRLGVG